MSQVQVELDEQLSAQILNNYKMNAIRGHGQRSNVILQLVLYFILLQRHAMKYVRGLVARENSLIEHEIALAVYDQIVRVEIRVGVILRFVYQIRNRSEGRGEKSVISSVQLLGDAYKIFTCIKRIKNDHIQ